MSGLLGRLFTGSLVIFIGLACLVAPVSAERPPGHPFSVTWSDFGNNKPLNDLHFADERHGWAVGDGGTILATSDGGANWHRQNFETDIALYGVHFADARTGWVVGASGTILATSDGGATWKPLPSQSDSNLHGVHFTDQMHGWAVGQGGTILVTTDGGENWGTQRAIGAAARALLYAVHFVDGNTGWAVGTDGTILATINAGANWQPRPGASKQILRGVYFADERTGWVVGNGATILATTDGGMTWQAQNSTAELHLNLSAVRFADARTGWVVGDGGTILATKDGGTTWQIQKSGTDRRIGGIYLTDARTAWTIGQDGQILATRDGGDTWQAQRKIISQELWDVQFSKTLVGWAVGEGGTILKTSDGGETWQGQTRETTKDLNGLYFIDERSGWVIGDGGTMLVTHDGGTTWKSQETNTTSNLSGLYFANQSIGWAVGSEAVIIKTVDSGVTWNKINIDPKIDTKNFLNGLYFVDARTGWVVGKDGLILATHDGGETWQPLPKVTNSVLLRVRFLDRSTGWIVGVGGTILKTTDGGVKWLSQTSPTKKTLYHVYFANAHTGWVVGQDGVVLATRNGGDTWQAQKPVTNRNLNGVYFTDAQTSWIVGRGGIMLRSSTPVYAPWAEDLKVSQARVENALDLSFLVLAEAGSPVGEPSIQAKGPGERAAWNTLTTEKSKNGDGRWQAALKPSDYGIQSGKIEFKVQFNDPNDVPIEPIHHLVAMPLGYHEFNPWWERYWKDYWNYILVAFFGFAGLLSYVSAFGLILVMAPARLAYLGSAPGLDNLARPSGNIAFAWDLARKSLDVFFLPWIYRHRRVRHAWTKLYSNGKSKFDDLGKARANFVSEPEVLDAWVARSIEKVEAALSQLDLFEQRRIYVELPVRVGERGKLIDRPNAETLRPLFAKERSITAIVGGGGTGKSTLACALARWAFAADPNERLAPHRMIPVFVVQDTTDLVQAVTQNLRRMLGDDELPDDLVRGLLAKQRLLVIVDALSEREPDTQKHIEQVFAQNVPINAIVITSRTDPKLGAVDRTTLYPVRLDAARVVPFIIGYLDRMEEEVGQFRDGRVQLRLGERILGVAESGGHKTPITPLLVTLFVNSAVQRAVEGHSMDDMPVAVPEVFVDYLRRLKPDPTRLDSAVSDDMFIQAAQILASVSLGKNLVPQDFSPATADEALAAGAPGAQQQDFIRRLIASGVVEQRTPGGYPVLRFSLDPAAEYLAAIRQLFKMKGSSREQWQAHLAGLAQTEGYPKGPEGYLVAFATSYRAYRRDFSLPEVIFPWEKSIEDASKAGTPAPAATTV